MENPLFTLPTNSTSTAFLLGMRQATPVIPALATIIIISGVAIAIFKMISHYYNNYAPEAKPSIQEKKTPAPTLGPFSVGKTTVLHANSPIDVTIKKENASSGRIAFVAQGILNGKETELGGILVDWIRIKDDGVFGSEYYLGSLIGTLCTYGPDRSTYKWSKVYVFKVDNYVPDENIKGIGTALMQAAMEYSFFKGCQGRLQLDAVRTSHVFYYKLGMRTGNTEVDKRICELKTSLQGKKPRRDFGSYDMHLPEDAMLTWKEKIRARPIFAETLAYLDQ